MKNTFESINPNAQKRKDKAEKRGELSISHWLGELHSHTQTDISQPELPDDIVEHRKGSNCGKIPLEALLAYHNDAMKNEFIAITNHSRDGHPDKAVSTMTEWFMGMYLSNEEWIRKNFSKSRPELSDLELEQIKNLAIEKAKQVANYSDERIRQTLNDIDKVSGGLRMKVFKGIEASLLPDGSLDTPMAEQGEFEMINCSIYPSLNQDLFQPIVDDPDKYTDLVLAGVGNKRVNIMAHIGSGVSAEVVEKLRWKEIAKKSAENKVAIEINLQGLIGFIYNEILNYDKYPKDDNSWQEVLELKLKELIPLLGSDIIKDQLKPYFTQGLRIAINTDEHKNKFIKSTTDKSGTKFDFTPRDFRFWRAMKIVEKYFNNVFRELGLRQENIINTYGKDKLAEFFKK